MSHSFKPGSLIKNPLIGNLFKKNFFVSNLFAYGVIPCLTFLLGRGTDLFLTNFSSIRRDEGRQGEFLLWSFILLSYLIFCFLPAFLNRWNVRSQLERLGQRKSFFPFFAALFMLSLFLASGGLLLAAVFTPYMPQALPELSQVHVYASVLSSLLFFGLLTLSCLCLYFRHPGEGRLLLSALIATAAFCFSSYLLTGIVNSAMEIVYTVTCSVSSNRLRLFFSMEM